MKKLLILALLGLVMSVSACNMMHGAGEDLEDAGDAVKDAVN